MQLPTLNKPVQTVGAVGTQGSFSIAMNAKAFRVLSDGLYKDKIGSMVREISCNAYDSHVAAGCPDRQFDIHLPDKLEPWFVVRDYGTGLSPESIDTIFCSYFSSTKDQSNNAVGAFGLGAKTPFAYSDQFTVTSFYNGMMYSYNMFIAENGMPSKLLMMEAPTSEDNGVEIRVAVKDGDANDFANAVRSQLNFFTIKPNIQNYNDNYGRDWQWMEQPTYLYESEKVKIYRSRNGNTSSRINVIQGPVGYPLDFNYLNRALESQEDSDFLRVLYNIGANLYFPIGAISVIASREGMEYNEHTLNSLKQAIREIRLELTDWIKEKIANIPTVYEKCAWVNDNTEFRSIINGITLDLSPAKKDSNGRYYFLLSDVKSMKRMIKTIDNTGKNIDTEISIFNISTYSAVNLSGFSTSRNASRDVQVVPSSGNKVVIALRDTTSKPVVRMQHYFREHDVDTMYGLTYNRDDGEEVFTPKLIRDITKALGGFDAIELVSEMEIPASDRIPGEKSPRETYKRPTAYYAPMTGSEELETVSNWRRCFTPLSELKEGGVYLVVERQRITTQVDYDTRRAYRILCSQDKLEKQVYAVREADVQKLKESGADWVEFNEYVENIRSKETENPNIRRYLLAKHIVNTINSNASARLLSLDGLKERNLLSRFKRIRNRANDFLAKQSISNDLITLSGISVNTEKVTETIQTASSQFFEKLPLLTSVRHGYSNLDGEYKKHVVDYVNHFGG